MRFLRKQPEVSSTRREALPDRRPVRVRLHGIDLEPDISGALYVPDYRTLLVADLHLEKGSSFARHGLHIPPYDTRSTLAALESVIASRKPERLVSLGDSFHDAWAGERLADGDLAHLRRLSDTVDVCWLIGNHDPVLPSGLGGRIAAEIALGPLTLRHLPKANLGSDVEIAGHLHPVASISRRGRRVTSRSFVAGSRRLIMPAFGAYTGGLNVWSPEIASLFDEETFTAWMIGRRAIYGFSSRVLD
jgi:uncharacterized protein